MTDTAPYKLEGWDELSLSERNATMRRWQSDRFLQKMSDRGYVVLGGYELGAIEWCTGSDSEAERGRDSYGDCADCGEPVVWVTRAAGISVLSQDATETK